MGIWHEKEKKAQQLAGKHYQRTADYQVFGEHHSVILQVMQKGEVETLAFSISKLLTFFQNSC